MSVRKYENFNMDISCSIYISVTHAENLQQRLTCTKLVSEHELLYYQYRIVDMICFTSSHLPFTFGLIL